MGFRGQSGSLRNIGGSVVKAMMLVGFLVMWLLGLATFALSVYGLILAFKASIILGIIAFVLEPSPLVIGVVAYFGGMNVAPKIAAWLHLPI